MIYKIEYKTPAEFSDLWLLSDGEYLTGIWFEGSKDEKKHSADKCINCSSENEIPVLKETARWLNLYFSGKEPDFVPQYKIEELTPFRKSVLECMKKIPYGKTVTYGDIAKKIAEEKGIKKMSAQAVGGAVGWNPLCIIIPCHRVMGAQNKLTGYGGGLQNKIELLKLENRSTQNLLKKNNYCGASELVLN